MKSHSSPESLRESTNQETFMDNNKINAGCVSDPNEDHLLPDAVVTLKGFLKAPFRKVEEAELGVFDYNRSYRNLMCIPPVLEFWNSEMFDVFSVPNNSENSSSRMGGRNRRPLLLAITSSGEMF